MKVKISRMGWLVPDAIKARKVVLIIVFQTKIPRHFHSWVRAFWFPYTTNKALHLTAHFLSKADHNLGKRIGLYPQVLLQTAMPLELVLLLLLLLLLSAYLYACEGCTNTAAHGDRKPLKDTTSLFGTPGRPVSRYNMITSASNWDDLSKWPSAGRVSRSINLVQTLSALSLET